MRLLPHLRMNLHSTLPAAEVIRVMTTITRPRRFRVFPRQPFCGRVGPEQFQVERALGYGNSFLPVIDGAVAPDDNGSVVAVRMRINWFAIAFTLLWYGVLAWMAARSLVSPGDVPDWFHAGLAALALFYLAFMNACFWFEASRARRLLELHLRAAPAPG